MTLPPARLIIALACCLATAPAMAAKVTKVDVTGLADEVMEDNVRSALSLSDELDRDITARRLNYLLRQAEAETREALEPFGYYSPTITIERTRAATPTELAAVMTRQKLRGHTFYRFVLYIPNVLSVVVIAAIFSAIFATNSSTTDSWIEPTLTAM